MEITSEHLLRIRKIAESYHRSTGLDVDDLYGEGCLAIAEQMPRHDANKSTDMSFLYRVTRSRLNHWIAEQRNGDHHQPMPILISGQRPDRSIMFRDKLKQLKPEARKLCETILEDPDTYIDMDHQELTLYLRKRGWSWLAIRKAVRDVKDMLHGR